jgi:hypothetical protein
MFTSSKSKVTENRNNIMCGQIIGKYMVWGWKQMLMKSWIPKKRIRSGSAKCNWNETYIKKHLFSAYDFWIWPTKCNTVFLIDLELNILNFDILICQYQVIDSILKIRQLILTISELRIRFTFLHLSYEVSRRASYFTMYPNVAAGFSEIIFMIQRTWIKKRMQATSSIGSCYYLCTFYCIQK